MDSDVTRWPSHPACNKPRQFVHSHPVTTCVFQTGRPVGGVSDGPKTLHRGPAVRHCQQRRRGTTGSQTGEIPSHPDCGAAVWHCHALVLWNMQIETLGLCSPVVFCLHHRFVSKGNPGGGARPKKRLKQNPSPPIRVNPGLVPGSVDKESHRYACTSRVKSSWARTVRTWPQRRSRRLGACPETGDATLSTGALRFILLIQVKICGRSG